MAVARRIGNPEARISSLRYNVDGWVLKINLLEFCHTAYIYSNDLTNSKLCNNNIRIINKNSLIEIILGQN